MASTTTDQRLGVNSGQAIKVPCVAASTSNLTLSGEQTIDGVAVVTGDRVLATAQTTGSENGIWVADTGAWTRPPDWDGYDDIVTGTSVRVHSGTSNYGYWAITTTGTITIDTTSVTIQRVDADGVLREDLASTATDNGTKGVNLVYYEPRTGETGIQSYQFPYDNILRFIPQNLHDGIRARTDTTDLTTYFSNAFSSNPKIHAPKGTYTVTTIDMSGDGERLLSGEGATQTIIKSTETTTSILKADNTAAAGGTVTRLHLEDVAFTCASYQASMSAIKADGHSSNSTPAGVSYTKFERCYISNCGKGIDLSRTWSIEIDHCRIYSCAQPLVVDTAGNGITSIGTTYLGLTAADVAGGATVDDLIFLTEVRGATFTGGSIEGECDRWFETVGCDGIEVSGNFIEVKPTNPCRFETSQAIKFSKNYIRYKPSSADASMNNVFVYADGSQVGRKISIEDNTFSFYDKPTSGSIVFTGVGASGTNGAGLFHFAGNSIGIEQLVGDPVHITDYYMDPTISSLSNNFTCVETRPFVVKQGEFVYTATTPTRDLRGIIQDSWGYNGATSELFVNQTVSFREITSGTDPVSGQYNLITTDLTGANTSLGSATSVSLNDNVNVAFTFTSASTSRVTPRHRICVQRNSADGSTTSGYEAEITIHECPIMSVVQ